MERTGKIDRGLKVRLKICGLTCPNDSDWVNEAMPDFCGFVVNVPKSRRNITVKEAERLRERIRPEIISVGVLVDSPPEEAAYLLESHIAGAVQLHGHEDERYIHRLKELMVQRGIPLGTREKPVIIQAFSVTSPESIRQAEKSGADLILLDNGKGGTGQTFNWDLFKSQGKPGRPFMAAGGLNPENLWAAMKALQPWGVDMSSGVETDGKKDRDKILAAAAAVRRWNQQ